MLQQQTKRANMSKCLKKILVVEDEADIRDIIQIALADVGQFVVKLCASGIEALKEAPHFEPDLILLDLMMPKMDGKKVLLELRKTELFKETPIIFITAKLQLHEVDDLLQLGAISVMPKPFDPLSIADSIRKIWTEYNLAVLRKSYCEKLPSKFKALELAYQNLEQEINQHNLIELQRLSHNLNGSAATFGYPQLSFYARQLEEYIAAVLQSDHPVAQVENDSIKKLVSAIIHIDLSKLPN